MEHITLLLIFCDERLGVSPLVISPNASTPSENSVLRMVIDGNLERHEVRVNTLSFDDEGDILMSGDNHGQVILWDWQLGNVKLSFESGHDEVVFQAKFIPLCDQTIVTCGGDGKIRQAKILEGGEVEMSVLGSHEGEARGLCIDLDPGNPRLFYTSGDDGLIQRFDLRSNETPTQLFKCQSLKWKTKAVHLNTISIDPTNYNLAVGGIDDKYARVYDIRRLQAGSNGFTPPRTHFCHPNVNENAAISDLAFSAQGELVVSYYNEDIYLFRQDDMGLGYDPRLPSPTGVSSSDPLCYKGHKNFDPNKRVNLFGPKSQYVVSGSDCGRIYIWRKKTGELVHVTESVNRPVNCVTSHPHIPVLASGGRGGDIKVWTSTAAERATIPDKDMLSRIQAEDNLMEIYETESEYE